MKDLYDAYMKQPNNKNLVQLCNTVFTSQSIPRLQILSDWMFNLRVKQDQKLLGAYVQPNICYVRKQPPSNMILVAVHEMAHYHSNLTPSHKMWEAEAELYELLMIQRLRQYTSFQPTLILPVDSVWYGKELELLKKEIKIDSLI